VEGGGGPEDEGEAGTQAFVFALVSA